MKIAIPVEGNVVASVFARAPEFAILEVDEKGNIKTEKRIPNPGYMVQGGAGPAAVQALINEGAEAVVVPQVGPNALEILQAAGIRIYMAPPGIPKENALESVKENRLFTPMQATPISQYPSSWPRMGYGRGMGRGRGRGFGRGMRFGRGKGFGRGRRGQKSL